MLLAADDPSCAAAALSGDFRRAHVRLLGASTAKYLEFDSSRLTMDLRRLDSAFTATFTMTAFALVDLISSRIFAVRSQSLRRHDATPPQTAGNPNSLARRDTPSDDDNDDETAEAKAISLTHSWHADGTTAHAVGKAPLVDANIRACIDALHAEWLLDDES